MQTEMKSETSVQKTLKVSVESSAVHWLKIKEECKLDENEGFVPSGGNSLRNLRQAGHMVVKEGLKVHVRTHKDTQPKQVPNYTGYTWSLICLEFVLGLECLCTCETTRFMEGTYASGTVL